MEAKLMVIVCLVAFLQWLSMPLLVIGAQRAVAAIAGRDLLLIHVVVAVAVITATILGPLVLLGLLPLGTYRNAYTITAMAGGLLSILLTRMVRNHYSKRTSTEA